MSSTDLGAEHSFVFDGRPIAFRPGQSVGAVLTEAGIRSWRSTRVDGKPRGLFCGIGACYDCLITINDQPNQRACLATAQDDIVCSSTMLGTEVAVG